MTCVNCEILDEENFTCIPLECGDCETPDVENCICIVDIECQCNDGIKKWNEEYIDCGGVCDPCTCDYTPCIYLTNEATKIWKVVAVADEEGKIIDSNPGGELECRVDLTALLVGGKARWRFDVTYAPKRIIFTQDFGGLDILSDLLVLSPDSLALFFPISAEHVYYIVE